MSNNKPIYSIIIPVYKVEMYLEECLESVKNQTFTDFECIVVNDGSIGVSLDLFQDNQYYSRNYIPTDVAPNMQAKYIFDNVVGNDPRFKLYTNVNQGLASARNCAIKNSTGERLVSLDGDDYISPDFLSEVNQARTDDNILYYNQLIAVKNGQESSYASLNKHLPNPNNLMGVLTFPSWTVNGVSYFWKLDDIKSSGLIYQNKIGGEDSMFFFDNLFRLEESVQKSDFVLVDKAIYYYRQFDNQLTKSDKFEITLFENTTDYIESKLPNFRTLGIKYWIKAKLFIFRFRTYRNRLLTTNKLSFQLLNIKAKILTLITLMIK